MTAFQARDSVDTKVAKCIGGLRSKGHVVQDRVEDIPNLPVTSFDDLKAALHRRDLLLMTLSLHRSTSILHTVTDPHDKSDQVAFWTAAVVVVAILTLAITVSWWFLAAVVPLVFGYSNKVSRSYDAKVLRAAMHSEQAFCLLYRLHAIQLTAPDCVDAWFWEDPEESSVSSRSGSGRTAALEQQHGVEELLVSTGLVPPPEGKVADAFRVAMRGTPCTAEERKILDALDEDERIHLSYLIAAHGGLPTTLQR